MQGNKYTREEQYTSERRFLKPQGTGAHLGKLPPQAVDLEEAILGAIMIEKDALTKVIEFLTPDMFYKDSHQKIYEAIRYLFDKTQPIDILTVTQRLRQSGELDFVGGAFYITELTNRVASAANIEYHARIISEKYIQRRLISISTDIINNAYEETSDVFELLDAAEKNLFSIAESNLRRNFDSMSGLVKRSLEHLEEMMQREDGLTGVPTGFSGLDRITSGWQNSDLVILAARPGMGKTAFILSAVRNAAVDFNKPVAVFSLEMSSIQLVNRLISGEAELPQDKLRKGNLASFEWEQLHAKIGKLVEAPIFIDDTPALSIFELRAKCRRMKAQHNIELVVVDYLQLMKGSTENNRSGNREQEISSISRGLKAIAKELDVPVIALSQLSREVEKRGGNRRPILSDLRESGSIEQDADMVIFINRPEYYGLTENEEGMPTQGLAEIIIAKHRNGEVTDVNLRYINKYVKFTDWEEHYVTDNSYGPLSGISPSATFDTQSPGTIILPSKMDDIDDDEVPF